ncbi:MAG: arylesterase [Gemmatimonadetes bacterium]|nr:arylesterase [Gemmatimonadota bacterium]
MTVSCSALAFLMLPVALLGCRDGTPDSRRTGDGLSIPPGGSAAPPVVLFLGTSLTAGYGLTRDQAYPALLARRIAAEGLPHRVVNAGMSGETSTGARARAAWLMRQPFDVIVIETGANDMLRGADPDATRANIQALVDRIRAARPEARIVLLGLRAPLTLGALYARRFTALYEELADRNELPLVPSLLEGVGGVAALNLPDGVHPNAAGQRRIADNVWEVLREELTD